MTINFNDNFGASSQNVGYNKSKWKAQERSGVLEIFGKAKVLDYAPCKKKHTYGHITDAPEGRCRLYGRRSCLANQPQEVPRWQAQD